jgi:E-phenylitaconyl-CoA hydratase
VALEPIGMLQTGVPLGEVLRWALWEPRSDSPRTRLLRLGIVSELVENEGLRAGARNIADQIAARSPIAI